MFLWLPCVADADIIFLPCGFFLSSFFFSSPNLSGCRLDVYHTSTHGMALCEFRMQVWNVLRAARCQCRTQKIATNSPSGQHCIDLSGYIFPIKARIDNWKKLVKHHCLPQMTSQYGEHWPTSGWDLLASLGHPCKFQRVSCLGSVTIRHSSSGRQPNCGVEQRVLPIFGRAAITLGSGPHF